jgi:hypothetical protein
MELSWLTVVQFWPAAIDEKANVIKIRDAEISDNFCFTILTPFYKVTTLGT